MFTPEPQGSGMIVRQGRWRLIAGLLLLAGQAVCLPRSIPAHPDPVPGLAGESLRIGLDPEQVRAQLGAPLRKSRQIFSQHAREQWFYGPPRNVRVTFACARGQKPQVIAFSPLRP